MMEALGLHVHLIEVALASHDEHVRFVNGVRKTGEVGCTEQSVHLGRQPEPLHGRAPRTYHIGSAPRDGESWPRPNWSSPKPASSSEGRSRSPVREMTHHVSASENIECRVTTRIELERADVKAFIQDVATGPTDLDSISWCTVGNKNRRRSDAASNSAPALMRPARCEMKLRPLAFDTTRQRCDRLRFDWGRLADSAIGRSTLEIFA